MPMSDKFKCTYCGSANTEIEEKGNQTGLYCCDCGKWIKWLNKEDIRVFNAHHKGSTCEVTNEGGIDECKFAHWLLEKKSNFAKYQNATDKDAVVKELIETFIAEGNERE